MKVEEVAKQKQNATKQNYKRKKTIQFQLLMCVCPTFVCLLVAVFKMHRQNDKIIMHM